MPDLLSSIPTLNNPPVVFSFGSISAFGPLSESQLLLRISSARIVWGFPFGLVASAGCIRGNTRSLPTPELRGKSTPYFRLPLRGDFSEWIPPPRALTVRLCDSKRRVPIHGRSS